MHRMEETPSTINTVGILRFDFFEAWSNFHVQKGYKVKHHMQGKLITHANKYFKYI